MSLDAYIQACEERFTSDDEYRARLQRELFDTDSRRSIEQLRRYLAGEREKHIA